MKQLKDRKGQAIRKLSAAWECMKLAGAVLFIMAAGAAAYHQYYAIQKPQIAVSAAAVTAYTEPDKQYGIEYVVEELTPEEIEEEIEYDSLELMAICVEAEAGNQSLLGKRLVADVILNRVDAEEFPDTIEGVISQEYQFSSYWDGGMDKVWEPSEETILAVQMELEERSYPALLYFTAGDYSPYGTPWKQVGDHYFSTR